MILTPGLAPVAQVKGGVVAGSEQLSHSRNSKKI